MRKATGSYRTLSLVKLPPWCLSLRWNTCLWAEHSDGGGGDDDDDDDDKYKSDTCVKPQHSFNILNKIVKKSSAMWKS